VAYSIELAELFDIDVDQLSGMLALVAAHRFGRLQRDVTGLEGTDRSSSPLVQGLLARHLARRIAPGSVAHATLRRDS
jgi:hypothetical protein